MRITFLGNHSVSFSSESHHAATLESMGHEVIRLQEAQATSETIFENASNSQIFVWIHTHQWPTPGVMSMVEVLEKLKLLNIPTITYHLDLWKGLQREKDLETDKFYHHIGHFFTVDKLMADWFNENTNVKGHYLPAGVFDQECIKLEPHPVDYEVIFVGSRGYHPEYPYRPQLIDWLRETYGSKFLHVGGDGDTGVVRGLALNQVYANAKTAIGDTLNLNFSYPYYKSDRYFEAPGRGGFMIFPRIYPVESNCFIEGKEMAYYKHGDLNDLKEKIDYYLTHDDEREAIRKAGFLKCKQSETYLNRWQTILDTIFDKDYTRDKIIKDFNIPTPVEGK